MMSLQKFLNNLANPFVKPLLRSPLHGLFSGRVVLLEFKGRKSGKIYKTPVMYGDSADGIVITTHRAYAWWRNLSGGAQVRAWLRGDERQGYADVSTGEADIHEALHAIYPKASPAMLAQISAKPIVVIHVRLTDQ